MSFLLTRFLPNLKDVVRTGVFPRQRDVLIAESLSDHRVSARINLLELLPKGGVGAELGVFTGLFSASLLRHARPRRAYFVDPWWTEFGENYPDWGPYTSRGRLRTRDAHRMAKERIERNANGAETHVVVGHSESFLRDLPDASLDWVYLDSTHSYEGTLRELEALQAKVKPRGIIAGDDWHLDDSHHHAGVRRAVKEFVASERLELLAPLPALQWATHRR